MKLNLELFSSNQDQKLKQLIVCLRDSELEKSAHYEKDVKKNLEQMWDGIQKPDELKSKLLSDFFQVKIVFLPHLRYQNELFIQEVAKFKAQFDNL